MALGDMDDDDDSSEWDMDDNSSCSSDAWEMMKITSPPFICGQPAGPNC